MNRNFGYRNMRSENNKQLQIGRWRANSVRMKVQVEHEVQTRAQNIHLIKLWVSLSTMVSHY